MQISILPSWSRDMLGLPLASDSLSHIELVKPETRVELRAAIHEEPLFPDPVTPLFSADGLGSILWVGIIVNMKLKNFQYFT